MHTTGHQMLTADNILDAADVAAMLRCSEEHAEDLMRTQQLAATKEGRGWITTHSIVVAYVIAKSTRRAPPAPAELRSVRSARTLPDLSGVHVVG